MMRKWFMLQIKTILLAFSCGLVIGFFISLPPDTSDLLPSPYGVGVVHKSDNDSGVVIKYYYITKDGKPLQNSIYNEEKSYALYPSSRFDELMSELNFYEKQENYRITTGLKP